MLILLWLWAILASPVLRGFISPTTPFFTLFLLLAFVQRITANPTAHGVSVVLNWVLLLVFIGLYAMQ